MEGLNMAQSCVFFLKLFFPTIPKQLQLHFVVIIWSEKKIKANSIFKNQLNMELTLSLCHEGHRNFNMDLGSEIVGLGRKIIQSSRLEKALKILKSSQQDDFPNPITKPCPSVPCPGIEIPPVLWETHSSVDPFSTGEFFLLPI